MEEKVHNVMCRTEATKQMSNEVCVEIVAENNYYNKHTLKFGTRKL